MFPDTTATGSASFDATEQSHTYRQKGFHSLSTANNVRNYLGNFQIGSMEQLVVRELRYEADGIMEVRQNHLLQCLEFGRLSGLFADNQL